MPVVAEVRFLLRADKLCFRDGGKSGQCAVYNLINETVQFLHGIDRLAVT